MTSSLHLVIYHSMQATAPTNALPVLIITTNKDISPLDLPETLSRILSFVDQTTLRTSAVFVSRLWLLACRHQLVRELTWEGCLSHTSETSILERLPYAGRLCWIANSRLLSFYTSPEVHAFKSLVQALKDIQERQEVSPAPQRGHVAQQGTNNSRSPTCIRDSLVLVPRTLQELVMTVQSNVMERFTTLAPYLSTLTDLRLRQSLEGTMQMGLVFQACPHLQVLHLASNHTLTLLAPWHTPPLGSDHLATTTTRHGHQHPILPLTTLVLENPRFIQEDFEQFLSSTPHLRVLKIVKLQKEANPGSLAGQSRYDYARIFNHLQRLNQQLRVFHFSVYGDRAANAAIEEMMMATTTGYGSSTEWDFAAEASPTPRLMRHIRQLSNVVTSLTFYNLNQDYHEAIPFLHHYLCNSPHLIHLWAPMTYYPIAHMDLFRRIPEPINRQKSYDRAHTLAEIKSARPGVWKCRNLETLNIGFQVTGGWGTQHQPEQSRVVFGYIARVLPRLRELRIHTVSTYQAFPFQKLRLSGGFCLLAKLRYLERLKICDSQTPQPPKHVYDLDWMVQEGWTVDGREARRRAMAPWGQPIQLEDEVEAKRVAKRMGKNRNRVGGGVGDAGQAMEWESSVDPGLREELQHLGRLLDVKVWLDEMVAPGSSAVSNQWPSLQKLAIASDAEYGLLPPYEFIRLTAAREYNRWEGRR
ncbi:hypothetical protein K457DRAFT_152078 [Linnemannia elongata AG-77]|uniref:F-box domain-containing protein n=1 Tax=Linnemannia elongata AG-77 TaxID=1314771 RepID=A0A197KCG4_9FUNG|nr:hypothetical protein K457DRAFT_152078 [Linnemannia elongata AG-77]